MISEDELWLWKLEQQLMKILICITELNYILKYIIYIYIYICKSKYNLTQRRAKTPHMTGYRTSEHNETNAHWRIFRLFCKMETNVAYISASVNIVKISILIVSKQRHSSWNSALDVLKLSVTLWVRSASDDSHAQEGTERIIQTDSRTKTIHWFTNCFDQAFEQNWLQQKNDSKEWIIREWASLIAQRTVDVALGINWSIFNLYCIKIK